MTSLPTLAYLEQAGHWPSAGRHVLAHFDDASIIVYQAYRQSIAQHALALLAAAVVSSHDEARYPTRSAWELAVTSSSVRLQWDPDHDPAGAPQARRALQLGLRGDSLRRFATTELLEVIDMSPLIDQQRENSVPSRYRYLQMPAERVYVPQNHAAATNVQLDAG